ncbi:hypothetical protein WJX73_003857 [Symbiochloris irregularis]|uniref:C2 domain-containing protein n=1 Tax=Symbiochloris irregularis TaxID=706552 RepID=A0AAW1PQ94_9CHLO
MSSDLLTISDISASGLGQSSPDDDVSKHTPYVEFTFGQEEKKTASVKKAATEVSWDKDTVSFSKSVGDVLTAAVWHKRHVLSNVVIGKGQLTKAELQKNGPVEVSLTEPKSGARAGTLKFTISGNPESQSKPTSGDTHAGTAGFGGGGAMAHDEAGVKTGRALKDSDSAAPAGNAKGATGEEAAAISAGAAAAAAGPQGSQQTYTDAAKVKAASAADFTTEKLQDLKLGLVGQEGAAKAEGKAPVAEADTAAAKGTYVESAKAGAAYVITKAQDALQYTKERVTGSAADYHGAPAAGSGVAPVSSDVKSDTPSTAEKVESNISGAGDKASF